MGVDEQTPLGDVIITVEPAPPCRVPDWCFWPAILLIIITLLLWIVYFSGTK
jgi:hypothetical protein